MALCEYPDDPERCGKTALWRQRFYLYLDPERPRLPAFRLLCWEHSTRDAGFLEPLLLPGAPMALADSQQTRDNYRRQGG